MCADNTDHSNIVVAIGTKSIHIHIHKQNHDSDDDTMAMIVTTILLNGLLLFVHDIEEQRTNPPVLQN